jgi:hypothetical protein
LRVDIVCMRAVCALSNEVLLNIYVHENLRLLKRSKDTVDQGLKAQQRGWNDTFKTSV